MLNSKELKKVSHWIRVNKDHQGNVNSSVLERFIKDNFFDGLKNGDWVSIDNLKQAAELFTIENSDEDIESCANEAYDEGAIYFSAHSSALKFGTGYGEQLEFNEFKRRSKETYK